jgi:broad specificity phosphatase PhoE
MEPTILPGQALAAEEGALPGSAPDLWLVRHGESTWNVAGLAQGQHDQAELTERGLRQASDTAWRFRDHPIRAIYASDLRRALQTAAAFVVVVGVPVFADARLRERSLGVLEGSPSTALSPAAGWSTRTRDRPAASRCARCISAPARSVTTSPLPSVMGTW